MVLTQGGLSRGLATAGHDPVFTSLLAETRNTIVSADFERVLEVCLDRATELLFDGLERNVFDESTNGGEESRLRLASLLPGLARWSHLAVNGLPNELVDVSVLSCSYNFYLIRTSCSAGSDGCAGSICVISHPILQI